MGANDNFQEAFTAALSDVGAEGETTDEQTAEASNGEHTEEGTPVEGEKQDENEDAADESTDSDDDSEDDDSDQSEESDGAELDVEGLREAMASGDLGALAKALGVEYSGTDAKAFAALRTKFRAEREKVGRLKAAHDKQQLADAQLIDTKINEARETYGDGIAARKAWESGDAHEAGRWIEKAIGADLSEITLAIAQGRGPVTPETRKLKKEREALEAERAKLRERAEAEKQQAVESKQREAVVSKIHRGLKHAFVKDLDDAREIVAELDKTWDPQTRQFAKTPKQVADELLERDRKRAEKRGLTSKAGAPKKKTAPKTPKQLPPKPAPKSRKERLKEHEARRGADLAATLREWGKP